MIIFLFPSGDPITPPIPEPITVVNLIEEDYYEHREPGITNKIDSLAKEISMNTKSRREELLLHEIQSSPTEIELPKSIVRENSEIIISEPLLQSSKRIVFDDQKTEDDKQDKIKTAYTSKVEFGLFSEDERFASPSPEEWQMKPVINRGVDKKEISHQRKNFNEDLPGEELTDKPEIQWEEGAPRALLYVPSDHSSYQGQIEGKIQLRFWVDKSGYVIKAIPQTKLSPELEEKALSHVMQYRFEPSDTYATQEGIITINFMLD